jgi:hypothetical protein
LGLWAITLAAAERAALNGGPVRVPGRLAIVAVGPTIASGDEMPQRVLLVEGVRADAEAVCAAFTATEGVIGSVEPAPDGQYRKVGGGHVEVLDRLIAAD